MKFQRNVFRSVTLIFQFGINMLVPILLCSFVGIFLDRIFHTSFIVIILFFLGAMAGFRNIYIFAQNDMKKKTYLGSDADSELKNISEGKVGSNKEDIFQSIDRIYKENMHE